MHCHILPGLDDGTQSMEETLEVLRTAADQQIRRMIVTPHYHPGRYTATAPQIAETLEKVKEECRQQQIAVTLYPGQECLYFTGLIEELEKKNALTLAGSRYVLIEFETDCQYSFLLKGLQELRCAGYQPILAHFERYECLREERNLEELREREYRLQMNFDTVLKKNTLFHRYPWKRLVQENKVDYLGSDCHGMRFRPLQGTALQAWMHQNLSADQRTRMIKKNFRDIIRNT